MWVEDNSYIGRLLRHLQIRLSADQYPLHQKFAQLFWARTLEEDLAARDVSDDAGATIEALRRIRNRRSGQVTIDLLNPVSARDGWQSSHSVVMVTAPNMPFMVDSILIALSHDGLTTHHLNNVVLGVDRDDSGTVTNLSMDLAHPHREVLIYAEIDRQEDEALPKLQAQLDAVTRDLQAVVTDFDLLKGRLHEIIDDLQQHPPPLDAAEVEEGIQFLQWLLANHFTFLGYREFVYTDGLIRQSGPALGVMRLRSAATTRRLDHQPERAQKFLMDKSLLSFSKSGTRSRVHRPAYPDYVGIKRFDEQGQVIGEVGFLGLYTSRVYQEFPEHIPVVRQKVANTLIQSGLDPAGFDGKVLAQVLATYPRDELFQIREQELLDTAMVITDIHERRKVRVFPRYDAYGLFVSVLVYMPRDLFSTAVRLAVNALLVETFDAEDSDHDILLSESILVRVHFNLRISPTGRKDVDRVELENRIADLIGDWNSELQNVLVLRFGETLGRSLHQEYVRAFSAGYRERFTARAAMDDITEIEKLDEHELSTQFYRLPEDTEAVLRLKIFHLGAPLPLSDVVPKLENLGLRVIGEHPYEVRRQTKAAVAVHDYELRFDQTVDVQQVGVGFNDAFVRIWQGRVEDDRLNRLILFAGLSWREVSVLRAYAQYMKQTRFGFSQYAISDTLFKHKGIAADLINLFNQRFAPQGEEDQQRATVLRIGEALDHVALLNEDRILRRFLELIEASLRTNYFVEDEQGHPRPCLAIKFQPAALGQMPVPVPEFEVFVSAPHVEGVHLRGGSISRGGLRWSDRLEDFRTEVLGLVKAQVVKNAVIVPTGAKGGFVVKGSVSGVECYRDFISSLLDVTDNIQGGEIQPPARVKAYDPPDPYLVVAADKGTATFSDTANAVAAGYGFWLDDAFASGGSYGYDHKKMGITARGAWVSVQRHFAELGMDVQTEPVTVLGIGDMAGDVFGNGMLLSRQLRLQAAFNHQYIFLDPSPQPEDSFKERERLFALAGSTWTDYQPALISAGGGVYSRADKSIVLSDEVKACFGISEDQLAPDELINRLLKSRVDLIWNGGIGTYIKASSESHDAVGDRANDHLRVNGCELRCKVIGEGGNLGATQLGRIEFSLHGGKVNTDFIDNSAGVDCSDHEVNIKVALNELVESEDMTRKQRNILLESMTDEVAGLVLTNNYNQAQTLSLAHGHCASRAVEYQRLIAYLCAHADLDRQIEYMPSDDILAERYANGQCLTRPELAVLLAYTKTHVKNELIQARLPMEPLLARRVFSAFPATMVERYHGRLDKHRLVGEIMATQLANELIDQMGLSFLTHMVESSGNTVADVVRAFVVVAECFDFGAWFEAIRTTPGISAGMQLEVLAEVAQLGRRSTRWMLRHVNLTSSLETLVDRFKPSILQLLEHSNGDAGDKAMELSQRRDILLGAGLPLELAQKSAQAADLARWLAVIDTSQQRQGDLLTLMEVTARVGDELKINSLSTQLLDAHTQTHWQAMEKESLLDDLFTQQNLLGALVLEGADGDLAGWLAERPTFTRVWFGALDDMQHMAVGEVDFSLFAIMVRKLSDLLTKVQIVDQTGDESAASADS